jgi:ribosomal protein L11 methyltransferase
VIERAGAFGAGTHPTTRLCLALLLELPAAGGFAELGCGAGTLAIAAARLGFDPVVAVDASPGAVAATAANAARNAAMVRTQVVNLLSEPPPAAPLAAANVPLALHASPAPALPDGLHTLIASGVAEEDAGALAAIYEPAGLHLREGRAEGAWVALRLERA